LSCKSQSNIDRNKYGAFNTHKRNSTVAALTRIPSFGKHFTLNLPNSSVNPVNYEHETANVK